MWREPSSRLCALLARPYYNTLTWDENLSTFHQIWFIYFVLIVNESSASATIPILGRPNARFKSLHGAKWKIAAAAGHINGSGYATEIICGPMIMLQSGHCGSSDRYSVSLLQRSARCIAEAKFIDRPRRIWASLLACIWNKWLLHPAMRTAHGVLCM
jgi:hypothetical protein